MGFSDVPAAVRALRWQRHVVAFVDSGRDAALPMPPMTPARFASRLVRLAGGFIMFAKRRSLSSGLAAQLLDEPRQLFDLPLQREVLCQQLLVSRADPTGHVPFISRRAHIGYTTKIQLAAQC